MPRTRLAVRLFIFSALLGGCITSSAIRPTDLPRLDGYQASDPARDKRRVETLAGGHTTLEPGATLALDVPGGRVGGRFTAISVQDGVFRGETVDGRTVTAPVDQIRSADISQHHWGATLAMVGLCLLAAAGAVVFVTTQENTKAVNGRALRLGRGIVVASPTRQAPDDGWRADAPAPDTSSLPEPVRARLAALWTESARTEHASVPAFARLSLTLVAHGAPARLVEAAHRAALEEIDHARRAFALAAGYGGQAAAPGLLVELSAAPAVTAATLEALAAESLVDGCLLEGVAAAAAAESLRRATDGAVRALLAVTARDERGHAELAWEVVAWCCAAGGPRVARHVRALARRLPEVGTPADAPAELRAALTAHGWLAPVAYRQIARRTRLEVAARAETLAGLASDEPARAA